MSSKAGGARDRLALAMVTYFCPRCGTTRPPKEVICGYCGFDIRAFEEASYDEKLLVALFHPEPETSERAAFLLGVRKSPGAAHALERRYHDTGDAFLQRQVVAALDRIGGPEAKRVLADAATHYSMIVRAEALRRLIRRGGPEGDVAAAAARADPSAHVRLMAFKPPLRSDAVIDGV
jgi:HEAT repeat protein